MLSITVPLIHVKGHDRGDEKQDLGNGFQGSLQHCSCALEDRDFLTWLMNRFNPENMTLEISGGKN
jgi:hypothetical protein